MALTKRSYNKMFKNYPDVVSAKEVAEMVGIGLKKAYRLLRTGLPEKCTKKALNLKIEEIITDFYEEYMNGKLFKKAQEKAKLTAVDYKFTVYMRDWLETIQADNCRRTHS